MGVGELGPVVRAVNVRRPDPVVRAEGGGGLGRASGPSGKDLPDPTDRGEKKNRLVE